MFFCSTCTLIEVRKMLCPKCKSRNTYDDGLYNACIMCGERWTVGHQPPPLRLVTSKPVEEKRVPHRKKRPCVNCGRPMIIAVSGLCHSCYFLVHDRYEKGSPGYAAVLARARVRFSRKGDGNSVRLEKAA